MADFPFSCVNAPNIAIFSHGSNAQLGLQAGAGGAAVWPAANRAIFMAVSIEIPVLAQQMACEVTTQSGNIDVGIYDEKGNKIVTKGTTAVAAAGLQAFDIADTVLNPGVYFLAMAVDNGTAAFQRTANAIPVVTACGVLEMATAFVLPATATMVVQTTAYQPYLSLICAATI
jgi:hypothetical protein